ncbi:MAG: hypothetical protein AVDCRST_MAG66-249, partial [uncultured Pseudonocardia sp.]
MLIEPVLREAGAPVARAGPRRRRWAVVAA